MFKTTGQIEKIAGDFLNEFQRIPLYNIEAKKLLLADLLTKHDRQIADAILMQCSESDCKDCPVIQAAYLYKT